MGRNPSIKGCSHENIARPPLAAASLCALLAAASAPSVAASTSYYATLSGAAEDTPNASPGMGAAIVTFDLSAHLLNLDVSFISLAGLNTAAHIHCCNLTPSSGLAGVATETPSFGGFPTGVSGGMYSMMYDTSLASNWNPAFMAAHGGTTAGAEAAFSAGLNAGAAYLNIHSTAYPAGELRGFLITAVPEPAQWGMLLLGVPAVLVLALALARRRRD
ncbi:MAG: CHRD domain-containing protein [Burkholderiaceae bacterium]|nr:CHRD domain-containing protein [Burkholderiaceae bacterium]